MSQMHRPTQKKLAVLLFAVAVVVLGKLSVPHDGTGLYDVSTPVSTLTEVAAEKSVPGPVPPHTLAAAPPEMGVPEKKHRFVTAMLPAVAEENARLAMLRRELLDEKWRMPGLLGDEDRAWLARLRAEFKIRESLTVQAAVTELRRRVDVIPISLVLAQAAMESGWGTSRFALQGNNYFGQWCMQEGCGMIPRHREPGASHEVKRFQSVAESIRGYFRNINTNLAYEPLRELRACQRQGGEELDGALLAAGLDHYSATGDLYIANLRQIIRANGWRRLAGSDHAPIAVSDGRALQHFSESRCHVADGEPPESLQAARDDWGRSQGLVLALADRGD